MDCAPPYPLRKVILTRSFRQRTALFRSAVLFARFAAGWPYEPTTAGKKIEPDAVIPAKYELLASANDNEAPGRIGVLVSRAM
jgi:hypothetical protein